jgi:hypothetical protein
MLIVTHFFQKFKFFSIALKTLLGGLVCHKKIVFRQIRDAANKLYAMNE